MITTEILRGGGMVNRIFYLVLFIITNIVIFIGIIHRIITDLFGDVTIDQIIFNMQGEGGAIDESVYGVIILWIVVFFFIFIINLIVFFKFVWIGNNSRVAMSNGRMDIFQIKNFIVDNFVRFIYIFCCIVGMFLIFNHIEKKYDVISWVNKEKSDFIENNYKVSDITFKEKRNLILVFLESMEKGYANAEIFDKNLIPNLQQLARNNTTFNGHKVTVGSSWTQAAHVNMLMGLPLLFTPNQTFSGSFMAGAPSVMDVLSKHGYKIYSLFGASGRFADMTNFFASHSVEKVWERDYFDAQGYNTPENKGTVWGYKDSFVYDKMLDLYKELRASGEPFCIIMRTVDTHFPHGFVEKEEREFGDIRDAFVTADRMSVDFLNKITALGIENTTIVFIGDHLWMKIPGINFTDVLMPKLKNRQIYNVFINSSVKNENGESYRSYAAFDMAPTILESVGAKLEGRRFGLGTSLFSKQKTLLEQYGTSYINSEFKKHSSFYGRLVGKVLDQ